jgi:acyl carrier protein
MARRAQEHDMTEDQENARALLADALSLEAAAVPAAARIGAFERWDSLAHVRIILALERRIGRQLDPDDIVQIECLDDIARLLKSSQRA